MAKKILLADDSVTIQKVVELTFMDENYEVTAVSNGDEALARLDDVAPDLVIADVHMPGADGYAVCKQAKERRPSLPVLLLVGTFEPFQEADVEASGADGFLKKPFDSQELLRRVEELLAAAPEPPARSEEEGVAPAAASVEEVEAEALPEVSDTAADEMEPWATVEEELPEEVATPEEIWQGEPIEAADEAPDRASPALGDADDLELEASPWTEAEEETSTAGAREAATPAPSEMPGAEGEAPSPPAPSSWGPQAASAAPSSAVSGEGRLSEEDVERIARRVAEILGPGALREVAWEVVPDLAELVIKDRVRELERQLE